MGLFRRSKEPTPELVAMNYTAAMIDALDLPLADAYCPEAPVWWTQEQYDEWLAQNPLPSVEELMQDPDVRAVVEAFTMKPVSLETDVE